MGFDFVRPGDDLRIAASEWNDVRDVVRWWRKNKNAILAANNGGMPLPSSWVWIKNTTTSDLGALTVLGIDQPVFDFTTTGLAHEKFEPLKFKGIAPSTSTPHYGQYAILQEPALANGGFARAVIAGPTLCKVSITATSDRAVEITNNQTGFLTTGYWGSSRILWKQLGTGSNKLALIRVGDELYDEVLVKNASGGDYAAGSGPSTYQIWSGTPGTETYQSIDISAYNKASVSFKNGKFGSAAPLLTKIYAVPWQT